MEARAHEPQPSEMNESRTEERQEQPVAAGGRDAEDPDALGLWAKDRERRHHREQAADHGEENRRLPGPGHPGDAHDLSSNPAEGEALGDVVAHEPYHERAGKDRQDPGRSE